jgi:hypothetical protein
MEIIKMQISIVDKLIKEVRKMHFIELALQAKDKIGLCYKKKIEGSKYYFRLVLVQSPFRQKKSFEYNLLIWKRS